MYKYIILIALCAILAGIFMYQRVKTGGVKAMLLKTVASFSFVVLGAYISFENLSSNGGELYLILGLVCGLIGDILLDLKVVYKEHNDIYLNTGMLFFGFGHIFYLLFALSFASGLNLLVPLIVAGAVAILFTTAIMLLAKPILKLDFGKFKIQSAVYSFILSFMMVFSIALCFININFWILALGLTLFLLSDLVLSLMYFGGKQDNKILCIINHTLYYLAQIAVACSILVL